MKLVLPGGFRGGQCLITVQLRYNSACISIFIQGSRCWDTMNSVKILHAVRSAITAIAEFLVAITITTNNVNSQQSANQFKSVVRGASYMS